MGTWLKTFVFLAMCTCLPAQEEALVPGQTRTGTVYRRSERRYKMFVAAGAAVLITLDQGEADLSLAITAPDGSVTMIDAFDRGRESAAIEVAIAGEFVIVVRAVNPRNATEFRIALDTLPDASVGVRRTAARDATSAKRLGSERVFEKFMPG
jgi:hypothetical protein